MINEVQAAVLDQGLLRPGALVLPEILARHEAAMLDQGLLRPGALGLPEVLTYQIKPLTESLSVTSGRSL